MMRKYEYPWTYIVSYSIGYVFACLFLVVAGLAGVVLTLAAVSTALVTFFPCLLVDKVCNWLKK